MKTAAHPRTLLLAGLAACLILAGCDGSGAAGGVVVGVGDTAAPKIRTRNVEQGAVVIPGEPYSVSIVDESSTLAEVDVAYDGQQLVGQAFQLMTAVLHYEVPLGQGTHELTVHARDEAGNESDATITFTVDPGHRAHI